MKLYGGIDLHSSNCVVTWLDALDHTVYEKHLPSPCSSRPRVDTVSAITACSPRAFACAMRRRPANGEGTRERPRAGASRQATDILPCRAKLPRIARVVFEQMCNIWTSPAPRTS